MLTQIQQTAVAVAGLLVATAAVYLRQHRLSIWTLPAWWWRISQLAIRRVRARFWTVPRGEPDLVAAAGVDAVRTALQRRHFEDGWLLSAHYRGEDANCRRPVLVESSQWPQQQDHVRLFARDDGHTELEVHREPAPMQHPRAHLSSEHMDVAAAKGAAAGLLESAGIDVRAPET